jgi:Tfp pilus assembly protein PilZ
MYQTMTTQKDQRREERVNVALPVRLKKATGVTRDVSASGVCFEVDANYTLGSEITFVIEVETAGQKILMKFKGNIVRTENHGTKKGVAVKITESAMEAAPH